MNPQPDLTADLRRRRPASGPAPEPATPEAVIKQANQRAEKQYPHKVTLELDDRRYRALKRATAEDDVTIARRLRGLIDAWMETRGHGNT
jgi:hypothetical protein